MTEISTAIETIATLKANLTSTIKGREDTINLVLSGLVANGHVLIEDYPGSGKTTLAKVIGGSIDCNQAPDSPIVPFRRIQFTPDLLPGDVLGVNIYNPQTSEFTFKHGPVFANIVLADEINRTGPKVQAAFLECMAERQVTIDSHTYPLDSLFFVIGTQNPLEIAGTYQLPLVQLDRFLLKVPMRYVDAKTELGILQQAAEIEASVNQIRPVISKTQLLAAQQAALTVHVSEPMLQAIVNIVQATRVDANLQLGASTRAALMLSKVLKAWALIQGRDFATEDDLKYLAPFVLLHRLRFKPGVSDTTTALQRIVEPQLEKLITRAV